MPGSKRNKVKKAVSPLASSFIPTTSSPATEQASEDSDGLLDDLLAQIDSKQHTDKEEAATILRQIENTAIATDAIASQQKKSNRNRFEARQVSIRLQT